MFTKLINKFSTTLYIELWVDRVKVTNTKMGYTYSNTTLIAIEKDQKGQDTIVAIGSKANIYPNALNPFAHKRVLFDNFEIASMIMRYAFEQATQKRILFSPIAIIKVIKKLDTPITQIEQRALCELLTNAGARESIILDNNTHFDIDDFEYETLRDSAYCCEERIKMIEK